MPHASYAPAISHWHLVLGVIPDLIKTSVPLVMVQLDGRAG